MIAVAQFITPIQQPSVPQWPKPQTLTEIVSHVTAPITDVEEALLNQKGMKEAPFKSLDRSGKAVCRKNNLGICPFGQKCTLRHLVGEKAVVCKHWLRGLCKKGDQCEFLHEYDLTKMPECFFFSKFSACSNRECPFRHIDPETKIKDCPWYDRGFCRHGPYCKHRHRRRVMCPNFLAGFCPSGPECQYAHPTFHLPSFENPIINNRSSVAQTITCHNCHEKGHKATHCPTLPGSGRGHEFVQKVDLSMFPDKKNLSDVTCYKCGEKGHYANRCHKGALAFLSNTAHLAHEQREKDEKEQGRFMMMRH
ncbi:unnamed protein product [Caenorhabditis angaria]|uniref:Cleavage and polyadenylation specificity factor subunit 4 n=1 Tax=Caenorhabditis angaria TaxID=860376 RepID=A0A9P1N0W5_9PELO|nr:unnamed protein product [Caenorhabditis angaria]